MADKKTADFYLRKSHKQLKACRRLAEKTVQSRVLLVEVCASLNSILTALVLQLQEIQPGGPGGSAGTPGEKWKR